jgi:two-component system chemotaxis response regulator CheB
MNAAAKSMIRVLVVEKSRAAAEFLTQVLNSDRRIRVVGVAANGEEAVEAAQRMNPDVITMDVHMPKMDGLEATRKIMETCPTPIVIVTGAVNTGEAAINFRAIEAGALAVVVRPNCLDHPDSAAQANELVNTVKLMSEVKVVRRWARRTAAGPAQPEPQAVLRQSSGPIQAVAIGASTGGPLALHTILSGLPKEFPLPVLIVQHMTPGFAQGFVDWLADSSRFAVRIATDGERLLPGHAYVAPDDVHMGVRLGNRILLSKDEKERGMRPSVSYLFGSVARVFGANAVGILLSGMGKDGAEELKRLRDAGAVTIAQDEESSVVHGMPGEAIQIGAARHVLPPEAIATILATIGTKL